MTPESIDYRELYKCIEHDSFLNNPMYANLSLDDAIVQLLKDFCGMNAHDGLKVTVIMRDILGSDINRIDLLWAMHKQIRTEAMFGIFKEVALKTGNWTVHE